MESIEWSSGVLEEIEPEEDDVHSADGILKRNMSLNKKNTYLLVSVVREDEDLAIAFSKL